MFSVEYRDQVRDYVLELADTDKRVTAGAVVGSLALSEGDRWSDLDLTFAVANEFNQLDVLEDWTQQIIEKFNAAHLFDLPSGASIYRVFLLPGCLQFDLSFTPASQFGATGPKFKLLFGSAIEKPHYPPPSARDLFGYAVHHALRARFCIERGKLWQAEYWIHSTRDYVLNLACLRLGLPSNNGRGYDALPKKVLNKFKDTFVTTLEKTELQRVLNHCIDGLLSETYLVQDLALQVEPQLQTLTAVWEGT
jgi:hypothetical protein